MRSGKRFSIFIITLLLVFLTPLKIAFAKAYTLKDLDITLDVPENVFVLTPDTPEDDQGWRKAGITDVSKELESYEKMGVQAVFITEDGMKKVSLLKKESNDSKQVFHFLSMTDEELKTYISNLIDQNSTTYNSTIEKYEHQQTPFFKLEIKSKDETKPIHELVYGTVINGYSLTFDIFKESGNITEEEELLLKEIVDNVTFNTILDRPEAQKISTREMVYLILRLAFVAVIVIAFVIYRKKRNKKLEAIKVEMRDNITAYRQKQRKLEEEGKPLREESLFSNTTTYDQDTVKLFSIYHLYVKNTLRWIYCAVLFVFILIMCMYYNLSGWIIIGISVLTILYVYYISTLPDKLKERTMKRFSTGKSKEAILTFYEDHFTVSGIQYISDYPYFQLTEVREYKEFVYLYFGPDVVYFLNMEAFEKGNGAEFKTFMKTKLGDKCKFKRND